VPEIPKASPGPPYRQVRYERPVGSCEIVLVRHGESAAADPTRPFPLVEGRGDPPLSKEGEAQAERLALRLQARSFDACYVTPLRRTVQTAAPLAERLGLRPVVEPRFIEVHMGEWEGGRYRERIAARDPLALRVFDEERFDLIPGGESNESLFARTFAAVCDISSRHRGGRVLVVAHAVSISSVLARATSSSPLAFVGIDNASISIVVATDGRLFLRRFNDTAHLEDGCVGAF
jgi:probable phosphoglycerate mutase